MEKNKNNNWVSDGNAQDDGMNKQTSFAFPGCNREHVSKRDFWISIDFSVLTVIDKDKYVNSSDEWLESTIL